MKTIKTFYLDIEIIQNLKNIRNASLLVERLLREYFGKSEDEAEITDKEAIEKAEKMIKLVDILKNVFKEEMGREFTPQEWLEFYNRWEQNEKGFGVIKYVTEIREREAQNILLSKKVEEN